MIFTTIVVPYQLHIYLYYIHSIPLFTHPVILAHTLFPTTYNIYFSHCQYTDDSTHSTAQDSRKRYSFISIYELAQIIFHYVGTFLQYYCCLIAPTTSSPSIMAPPLTAIASSFTTILRLLRYRDTLVHKR